MFATNKKMNEDDRPCELIDIRTGHRIEGTERIKRLVKDGWVNTDVKRMLDRQQERIEAELIKSLGMGTMARIRGLCLAFVRQHYNVKINNLSRLRVVLAERYPDICEQEDFINETYNLVELACDADDPLAPRVRECLTITRTHSIEWMETYDD